MNVALLIVGVLLVLAMLWDAFETIVQPRRVTRRLRIARLFTRGTWWLWARIARRLPERDGLRDRFLGVYGPLAVLALVVVWAAGLVIGFGLAMAGLGGPVKAPQNETVGYQTLLYLSGETFFTLGPGDVVALPGAGRVLVVLEAATGFSFLALIIGYIPALFSTFNQREVAITLLDARAGSPPTAAELLLRHGRWGEGQPLTTFLREWEEWSADLLGGYLSYPLLAHFRSQHEGQSWLAALTVIMDTCALLIVGLGQANQQLQAEQARLTLAIGRHALGDLAQIFDAAPISDADRLPPDQLTELRALLATNGLPLRDGGAADEQLGQLRRLYEPYAQSLANHLMMMLPPWLPAPDATDDWETTAWEFDPTPARRAIGAPDRYRVR